MIQRNIFLALILLLIGITANASAEKVIYAIDFSGQPDGPAARWLEEKGFEFKLGAVNLDTYFIDNRLKLQTQGENAGLFVKNLHLPNTKRIRIYWGVDRYPQGADWEKGVNAVPLAVMVSFGTKRIDSGAFYIPDAPYFIGLFLGEKEREGKPYLGRYFKKGGRYYCTPCGVSQGKTVITEFDLEKAFKTQFKSNDVPPLSRFGFQINTQDTRGGASAFLQRVEFLGS
jgi:hypothetical protein